MRNALHALALLGALAALACKREEPPKPASHEASPVGAQDRDVPSLRRPEARPPTLDAGAAVKPPTLPPAQGLGTADGGGAAPTGSSAGAGSLDAGASRADAGGSADAGSSEWTAGLVERKGPGGSGVELANVRAARQQGFDRVVIEFAGAALPGYHVEYVDKPIIRCGSGEPTEVAGQGWLQVRLTGARAHTEAGKPTVAPRERKQSLGVLRELEQTCDFEGEVTWVLGVQKPNRFRVLTLTQPTRLVVDVQQ